MGYLHGARLEGIKNKGQCARTVPRTPWASYIHTHTHTNPQALTPTRCGLTPAYTHTYTSLQECTLTQTHTHTHVRTCACACMHTRRHTCLHIFVYTHTQQFCIYDTCVQAKPSMTKSSVVDNLTGKSVDSQIRTSTGTFLKMNADETVARIEKRVAQVTMIPVGEWCVMEYPWRGSLGQAQAHSLSLRSPDALFNRDRSTTVAKELLRAHCKLELGQ